MAWSTPSTKENSEYQQAEQDAKEAKFGLWSQPNQYHLGHGESRKKAIRNKITQCSDNKKPPKGG